MLELSCSLSLSRVMGLVASSSWGLVMSLLVDSFLALLFGLLLLGGLGSLFDWDGGELMAPKALWGGRLGDLMEPETGMAGSSFGSRWSLVDPPGI